MKNVSEESVLVTGASGFVAMHCILKLLEKGYQVRGTLRSPEREEGCVRLLKRISVAMTGSRFLLQTWKMMMVGKMP